MTSHHFAHEIHGTSIQKFVSKNAQIPNAAEVAQSDIKSFERILEEVERQRELKKNGVTYKYRLDE